MNRQPHLQHTLCVNVPWGPNSHFAIIIYDDLIFVTRVFPIAASIIWADRTQQTFCTRLNKCAARQDGPTGGSISEFDIPLKKEIKWKWNSKLLDEWFVFLKTNVWTSFCSCQTWRVFQKHHLSCRFWTRTRESPVSFRSVSQLCLKLIIGVSCRLVLQVWILLVLVMCSFILPNRRTPHSFLLIILPLHAVSSFLLPVATLRSAFHLWSPAQDSSQ